MRTSVPKPAEPAWYVVDADGNTLGRLAARIASVLRGKNKPAFSPHAIHGDHVIVINASHITLRGRKSEEKFYVRHTGYLGHMKRLPIAGVLTSAPAQVIIRAVRGMLPRNRLRSKMLQNLHVFGQSAHPHEAQKPQPLDSLFTK